MVELAVVGFTSGLLGSMAWNLYARAQLRRRLFSLDCDIQDLQNKVLSEIKRRAVAGRWSDAEIKKQMLTHPNADRIIDPDHVMNYRDEGL